MKKIYFREEYCMACRLCEIHCLVEHSKSKKIFKAYKEEIPKPVPRIVVETKGPMSFALQCRHCDTAPCVKACISGAMYKDKNTGIVKCDYEKCAGCWMCIMVCPFGVIKRMMGEKKVAAKCDLCPDKDTPVCVENCPNEALIYEEK